MTNRYGTSTPAGQLTYVLPRAPEITTLSPATGLTHRTTPVTITGANLTGATVTLDGRPISFTKVSDTQIKLNMPKHAAGAATLRIVTAGGSTESTFTYEAPPVPAITGLSPASGLTYVRTPVIVTGSGFTDATRVTVGGAVTPFTRVSDTQIKLTLPVRGAGPPDVQITTPGGVSTVDTSARFRYEAPPVPLITSLGVTTASAKSPTTMLITGTGLTAATAVMLGTSRMSFTKISDTQIRVTVPARPAGTSVDLKVTTPGGTSAGTSISFA